MHLRPGELVFGVAPEILLDCAKQLKDGDEPITLEEFSEALGAPTDEAEPVLKLMTEAGYFVPGDNGFERARPFTQLAAARISNGLSRAEADALLARVLLKAQEINGAPALHRVRVECIVVFGSYLGDKAQLGDLDLGVRVTEISEPREGRMSISELRKALQGRSPSARARSALGLRRPRDISIHDLEEVLHLGTQFRVVFGRL